MITNGVSLKTKSCILDEIDFLEILREFKTNCQMSYD